MSTPTTTVQVGPFLACGIADAYGAGFEYTQAAFVRKHNRGESYIQHPRFRREPNTYTDTQEVVGLAEAMLYMASKWGVEWPDKVSNARLLGFLLDTFKRDPREKYSTEFYALLQNSQVWSELAQYLHPNSIKNGAAMRAFPCGYLKDPTRVRDFAIQQASITHATWEGTMSAAGAALMFHYCYHQRGGPEGLIPFLETHAPGVDWSYETFKKLESRGTSHHGFQTVRAALHSLIRGHSLIDVVVMAVSLGNATVSVAAIAAASAATCSWVRNAIPDDLTYGLENGTYGRGYLVKMDERMRTQFPPMGTPVKPKKPPKPVERVAPEAPPTTPKERLPLDFLFDE